MYVSKVAIKNFRLLQDVELEKHRGQTYTLHKRKRERLMIGIHEWRRYAGTILREAFFRCRADLRPCERCPATSGEICAFSVLIKTTGLFWICAAANIYG